MQFDFNALIAFLNTIFMAIFAFYSRKNANANTSAASSLDNAPATSPDSSALWAEVNDIRSTVNSTLRGINKQLRATGRTMQSQEDKKPDLRGGGGVILPPGSHLA